MSSFADPASDQGAPTPPTRDPVRPASLVVLISGRGSNLNAIIESIGRHGLPAVIRSTISDRPGAGGIGHARRAGIPVELVDPGRHAGREAFEAELLRPIDRHQPDLLVLAGFMRILSPAFVQRFDGRMINIHPSLLPRFPGLDTHRRALAEGATEHGASVHFVTSEVDGGPVILQGRVRIEPDDTPERLATRVLRLEHHLYPLAIRWFAEGRLRKHGDAVMFDGRALAEPLDYAAFASIGRGADQS